MTPMLNNEPARSYSDWYVCADQAWTSYQDTLEQIEEITGQEDLNYLPELTMEAKEWKEAAEYAKKMMEELEKCQSYPAACRPAQSLTLPFEPWINVAVRMDDGSVKPLTGIGESLQPGESVTIPIQLNLKGA